MNNSLNILDSITNNSEVTTVASTDVSDIDTNSSSSSYNSISSAFYTSFQSYQNNINIHYNQPNNSYQGIHFDLNQLPIVKKALIHLSLSDFTYIRYLASGSNADVYLAKLHGEVVVIKMIKQDHEKNHRILREFDVEFNILIRLNHPNIIKVKGFGKIPRRFIVLEYLEQILGTMLANNHINQMHQAQSDKLFHRYTFPYIHLLHQARCLANAFQYCSSGFSTYAMIIHRGQHSSRV